MVIIKLFSATIAGSVDDRREPTDKPHEMKCGSVSIEGNPLVFDDPNDARRLGLYFPTGHSLRDVQNYTDLFVSCNAVARGGRFVLRFVR
jgi:hypothetical protein